MDKASEIACCFELKQWRKKYKNSRARYISDEYYEIKKLSISLVYFIIFPKEISDLNATRV